MKKHLWPLLEVLVGSLDVQHFRSVLPNTKHTVGDVPNVHAVGRTTRSSNIKLSNTNMSRHPKLSCEEDLSATSAHCGMSPHLCNHEVDLLVYHGFVWR